MATPARVAALIAANTYLTLGTTDGARPWANAVEYVTDADGNLFFVSRTSSQHGRNIGAQAPVVAVIFDSTQPSMTGEGVQIEGLATRLDGDDNVFVSVGGRTDLPASLDAIAADLASYRIEPIRYHIPDPEQLGFERSEVTG